MRRLLQITICLMLVLFILMPGLGVSGIGESTSSRSPRKADELVIYTYESLLAWGEQGQALREGLWDDFEQQEGIDVRVEYFNDVGDMVIRAVEEKDDPQADIIIGIDNSMIFSVIDQEILTPYDPENDDIPRRLYFNLDTQYYVNPYDYGLITLVYHKEALNETIDPETFKLEELLNETLANTFIAIDPLSSSTGLGFMLWTIVVYEKILEQDWTVWWNQIRDKASIKKSWDEAFTLFETEGSGKHIMPSYGTDPAYSYLFYNDTSIGALLSHEREEEGEEANPNAWLQIEGIGIVKDTPHLEKAQAFVDWFLSVEVQQHIPENNWMFPANELVELPESFKYAVNTTNVTILNSLLYPGELREKLSGWLHTWEELIYIPSFETIPVILGLALLGAIVLVIKRRKNKKIPQ